MVAFSNLRHRHLSFPNGRALITHSCLPEPISFRDTSTVQTATEDKDATIRCEVRGHPEPSVSWYFNGQPLFREYYYYWLATGKRRRRRASKNRRKLLLLLFAAFQTVCTEVVFFHLTWQWRKRCSNRVAFGYLFWGSWKSHIDVSCVKVRCRSKE